MLLRNQTLKLTNLSSHINVFKVKVMEKKKKRPTIVASEMLIACMLSCRDTSLLLLCLC